MQIQSWSILGRSFHFGVHGMEQEKTGLTMPSDSLFSALVAYMARVSDPKEVEVFCQPFLRGTPPFVLTSTFPLAGNVRFFPPPLPSRVPPEREAGTAKSFKKVQFVSEVLYRRLLDGEKLYELKDVHQLQEGKLWASQSEAKNLPAQIWKEFQRPRVALDRTSQASALFFTGQVTFADDCGLWFGIRWLDEQTALKQKVTAFLYALADEGLGAERSNGLGLAKIGDMGTFDLPDPLGYWTNLSRYLPSPGEMESLGLEHASYQIKSVGGWLDSPVKSGQRRRSVNLLIEGSVFGALPCSVPGQMVDVRPRYEKDPDPLNHPVYRNGFALAVGVKGGA